jgi:hypothetical protein
MGICAPERASDVSGALFVVGADAGMMPASSRGGRCACAVRGPISATVVVPPYSVLTTFEAKVVTINRRHRPSLVLRTSDAESRGIVWKS